MKTRCVFHPVAATLLFALFTSSTSAQGTAFTYQGSLDENGYPVDGSYDLRFTIYDMDMGGSPVAGPLTNAAVGVSNGLFTVMLDFGAGAFDGNDRWLEIGAVTNGGGLFTPLTPRQPITSTPYAIKAANAMTVDMGTVSDPSFIGTTGMTPLDLFVNNTRALRLEDNGDSDDSGTTPDGAPNVIGGSPANTVGAGVVGATIAGGGAIEWSSSARPNEVFADYGTVSGGADNHIGPDSWHGTIGGGIFNDIGTNSDSSTIGGGTANDVGSNSWYSTIAGGRSADIADNSGYSTVGGGNDNDIDDNSTYGVIAGGHNNVISSNSASATISGGELNEVLGPHSSIGGGLSNRVSGTYSTVAGGLGNLVSSNLAVVAGGGLNVASGQQSSVGGGSFNVASGFNATVAGGQLVVASGSLATSGGGMLNHAIGDYSTVAGGSENVASNSYAAVGGGHGNTASGNYAAIGGGRGNDASASDATVAGGLFNTATAFYSTVGGGSQNSAEGNYAVVGGGQMNHAVASGSTVSGGDDNTVTGLYGTIPGGRSNSATNYAYAAGRRAKADHTGSFVWADSTDADFVSSTNNQFLVRASGGVGIGVAPFFGHLEIQQPTDDAAGGLAIANTSRQRTMRLWADGSNNSRIDSGGSGDFPLLLNGSGTGEVGIGTTSPGVLLDVQGPGGVAGGVPGFNQVVARFRQTSGSHHSAISLDSQPGKDAIFYLSENGGVQWMLRHVASSHDFSLRYLGVEKMNVDTNGNVTATSFNPPSDRNLKENLNPVSPSEVLEKVAALPISRWNFIGDEATTHVGPMAQDFHAAFGLGTDDRHIATVDADGVALAAIQGLNEKMEIRMQDAEVERGALQAENAELRKQLAELKQMVAALNHRLTGGD